MPEYRLECSGDCREIYHVHAESEDEAIELFRSGSVDAPDITECSTDVDHIEEVLP